MAGAAETNNQSQGTGDQSGQPETPNYEEIAREKGWRPFQEYEGPVSSWVGAEEFVKREPLFDKIRSQSKELRDIKQTLDSVTKHFKKSVEAQVQQRISQLEAERDDAIDRGDRTRVKELDKEIRNEEKQVQQETSTQGVNPQVQQFIDDNPWFNTNKEMQDFAISYYGSVSKQNPGDIKGSLDKTLEMVKRAFPDNFQNTRRQAPSTVDSGSPSNNGTGGKYDVSRLNTEQKMVYDQMVTKTGILSHDEYFKDLDAIGELQ